MNATLPDLTTDLTTGKLLRGFPDFFNANRSELEASFTPELQEEFETLEEYAIEVYGEMIVAPTDPTPIQPVVTEEVSRHSEENWMASQL